jgi:hypothetical protein
MVLTYKQLNKEIKGERGEDMTDKKNKLFLFEALSTGCVLGLPESYLQRRARHRGRK